MGQVIKVDFLFARMCRDIKYWYDKYYFGTDKETRKYKHLNRLEAIYGALTPDYWLEDPIARQQQYEEFLTFVQGRVNGYAM